MKPIEEVRRELAAMGIDTSRAKARVREAVRVSMSPTGIRRAWRWFLARFRLSGKAVCEMSAGRGLADFHDYPDSETPEPWHFVTHRCVRCGKDFIV